MRSSGQLEQDEESENLIRNDTVSSEPLKPAKRWRIRDWIDSIVGVIIILAVITALLILAFEYSNHYAAKTEEFNRPITDQRQYEYFLLSNGLKVVAISDPQATTSSAALSIPTGSYADPVSMPGLAHFLEHLIFLGSKKYPELNTFSRYVSSQGGSYNAFTGGEETNFHFQVPSSGFESAFDIFLHMFLDPIFSLEWAEAEVSAVNGEYNIDLQKDGWMLYHVLKVVANPKSPYSKFNIGNTKSLIETPEAQGVDVVKEIKTFFDTYYSPNLMSLVVLHPGKTDDIQNLVKKEFSLLDNRRATKPSYQNYPKPFSGEFAGKLVQYLPVGDDKTLDIIFCVDSSEGFATNNPLNYLYALLNYGGEGGLTTVLKNKEWILSLSIRSLLRQSSFELVRVEATLTDKGTENVPEIVKMVFAYIDLIKAQGLTEQLFEQFANITRYVYDYDQYGDSRNDLMKEVTQIASNMDVFPIKYVLSGDQVLYKFNEKLTKRFLDQLTVKNMILLTSDPKFKVSETKDYTALIQESAKLKGHQAQTTQPASTTQPAQTTQPASTTQAAQAGEAKPADKADSTEAGQAKAGAKTVTAASVAAKMRSLYDVTDLNRYEELYKLYYAVNELPREFTESLSGISFKKYPALKLPKPNQYIPKDFSMMGSNCTGVDCVKVFANDRNNRVVNILDATGTRAWNLVERSFGVPMTTCFINLNSASFQSNPKYRAASAILAELVKLVMLQDLYQINSAGHAVGLGGGYIKIEAFSETFPKILQKVLGQYKQSNYTQPQFTTARDTLVSDITNRLLSQPSSIGFEMCTKLLLGRNFTSYAISLAATSMTYQNFLDTLKDMQKSAYVETLLYGNVLQEEATTYANQVNTLLGYQPLDQAQIPAETVVNLEGKNLVYRIQTPVLKGQLTVTLNYYQDGVLNAKGITTLKILARILGPEAFSYLRTQKQLGYSASLRDDLTRNVMGLQVLVVSSSFDTNQVDFEIENFLRVAETVLAGLTEDDVKTATKSYGESLVYDSKSYRVKQSDVYSRITNRDYDFSLRDKIIEYLPKVTKQDLLDKFKAMVQSPKKLSIQLYSQDRKDMTQELLTADAEYSQSTPSLLKNESELASLPRYPKDIPTSPPPGMDQVTSPSM